MTSKVYIFDKTAQAEAFRLTAYYLSHEVTQIGSAVICHPLVYASIVSDTRAIPAALVTVEDDADPTDAKCPDCERLERQGRELFEFAWSVVQADTNEADGGADLADLACQADSIIRKIDNENG